MTKHQETHPNLDVAGCFGCHIANVNIGGFPTDTTEREKRWDRDIPAYRRLRHNGLQPKGIDGSAALEARANDQFEVEMGHIVPRHLKSRVQEGLAISKELQREQEAARA